MGPVGNVKKDKKMYTFKNISPQMRKVLSDTLDHDEKVLHHALFTEKNPDRVNFYGNYIHGFKECLRLLGYKYISRSSGGYLVKI